MKGDSKSRIRLSNEANILRAAEHIFARAGFAGATMAEIAERACIPKSNLHYYFKTKKAIYRAVLANILSLWLAQTDSIYEDNDPRTALTDYVRAKMQLSVTHPDASRVFANEVLHGAPEIGDYLREDLRQLVERKAQVIECWIAQGKMMQVDPKYLFLPSGPRRKRMPISIHKSARCSVFKRLMRSRCRKLPCT